jgi:hypothetical protein
MAIDPEHGFPLRQEERTAERLASFERRLRALEVGAPAVQVGAGPPTSFPRDGTLYGDTVGPSGVPGLWVRLGGAWLFESFS